MKFFILLATFICLSACQSAKDAMTLKKASGDEFLVEKKVL